MLKIVSSNRDGHLPLIHVPSAACHIGKHLKAEIMSYEYYNQSRPTYKIIMRLNDGKWNLRYRLVTINVDVKFRIKYWSYVPRHRLMNKSIDTLFTLLIIVADSSIIVDENVSTDTLH